jgi:hypothetical protein
MQGAGSRKQERAQPGVANGQRFRPACPVARGVSVNPTEQYPRISTTEQNLDVQRDALKRAVCEKRGIHPCLNHRSAPSFDLFDIRQLPAFVEQRPLRAVEPEPRKPALPGWGV